MEFQNLTKKELVDLLIGIQNLLGNNNDNQTNTVNVSTSRKSDLEDLIGSIPFLLLNQQIFEKNQDITDFATKLNIIIPSPEKKNREDMIGRIVSAIANFDKIKIKELNHIISSLKIPDKKKVGNKSEFKSSFFNEWDAAIKQMKI